MFQHKELQQILSVYVDDFFMAGRADTHDEAWSLIDKYLDLDPLMELDGSVYLGCGQKETSPNYELMKLQAEFYREVLQKTAAYMRRNERRGLGARSSSQKYNVLIPQSELDGARCSDEF